MWYNAVSEELQPAPPWGHSFLSRKMQKLRYPDWKQITDEEAEEIRAEWRKEFEEYMAECARKEAEEKSKQEKLEKEQSEKDNP